MVYSTIPLDTLKCSDWFSGSAENRLLNWRNFRNSLNENYLTHVAIMWARCPIIGHHLEQDSTRHWPDPWTLISDNIYCNTSVALGMYYTLYFTSYPFRDSMEIKIYKDTKKHEYLNLLQCEGGLYTLNYDLGRVVNTPIITHDTVLINTITKQNLPLKKRDIQR